MSNVLLKFIRKEMDPEPPSKGPAPLEIPQPLGSLKKGKPFIQ
jgi:hypothetical protein